MRSRINTMTARLHIQWIPGHCEIAGNEEADSTAKRAAKIPSPSQPVSYGSACALIVIRSLSKEPLIPTLAHTKSNLPSLAIERD